MNKTINNEILNLKLSRYELIVIKTALLEKKYRCEELKENCKSDEQISRYNEIIYDLDTVIQAIKVNERFNEVQHEVKKITE